MEKQENIKEADNVLLAFEKATDEDIQSGAIKFSSDYVSKLQLYEVIVEWVKDDSHVLYAAIRGGGPEQIAVDFRYSRKDKKDGSLLRDIIKPYFASKLGESALIGWDMARPTTIIK